ncbi:peptide chain release factor N(5)-glutamine methyltransferase [Candidatus Saccharibacteria bacterium]|nr:peptide chain release factor N(5)-glutamine methyltransferase [Candidatus Saccharibacteria bacterium]
MDKKSMIPEVTIADWLRDSTALLKGVGLESARLDAEIILAHTIKKPRTYVHAHTDEILDLRTREIANARLDLRLDFTPVAYIIGHKEFYGRRFKVSTATLIPRPETETMIDMVKESINQTSLLPRKRDLVDVGTGSGCVGITLKLELPELTVTLTDISKHALNVAEQNARAVNTDIRLHQGDLLRQYGFPVDIICANLPYVARDWEVSRDTYSEPDIALYANDDGLALIKLLIIQSAQLLTQGGTLYLEADPRQHDAIVSYAKQYSLAHNETRGFIVSLCKR